MVNTPKDPIILKIEKFFKVPEHIADKIQNIAEKVKGGYVLRKIGTFPNFQRL